MEKYQHVHLLLDSDTAGIRSAKQALSWNKKKYIDYSAFYSGYKDVNQWLIHLQ